MSFTIEEAITDLKEDIDDRAGELEELKRFEEEINAGSQVKLDEKRYHKLCRTALRTSDVLGKCLCNTFPFLKHIRGGCNYHFFQLDEQCGGKYRLLESSVLQNDSIEIRIPNSAVQGVEIVVKKFYIPADKEEKYINGLFNYLTNDLDAEIKRIKEFLEAGGYIKEAKLMFPEHRTFFALVKYTVFLTLAKQNVRRTMEIKLAEAEKERNNRIEKKEKALEEAFKLREEQQSLLRHYASYFLEWTDKVRVYENTYQSVKQEFFYENGKMTSKEHN